MKRRGRDGELKMIYWQSALDHDPLLRRTKDLEAASLVLEPLGRYANVARTGPLAQKFPTVENGACPRSNP